MQLSEIRDAVINSRGQTANVETAYLNDVINRCYRMALAYYPWPWLREHGHVHVYPVHTAEFTATNGLALFTSTDAVTPEWADDRYEGGWAYSGDQREIYRLTATAIGAPSTFTATTTWLGVTGPYDFSVFRDIYPLTEEVDQVLTIATTHSGMRGYKLLQVHDDEIERLVINRMYPSEANVAYWSCDGLHHDTDNDVMVPRIRLWPLPTEEFHMPYTYLRYPADLSADDDVPYMPMKHHYVLVAGALEYLSEDDGADADGMRFRLLKFSQQLEQMKQDQPKVAVPSTFTRWDRRAPTTISPDNWWGQINV